MAEHNAAEIVGLAREIVPKQYDGARRMAARYKHEYMNVVRDVTGEAAAYTTRYRPSEKAVLSAPLNAETTASPEALSRALVASRIVVEDAWLLRGYKTARLTGIGGIRSFSTSGSEEDARNGLLDHLFATEPDAAHARLVESIVFDAEGTS
ncbi:MAG: hypothetical protein JWM87_778 [Candidatus Eremiobacteraeota bacterium]|nr:hypothetical protein [Candidatus Eremiobacteraeota bacterium]